MSQKNLNFDAWNPGIESEIPSRLREKITLFRKENSEVSYQDAVLAGALCGLKPQEVCCLSLKRLVIHELLIRVTADLTVPDGPKYEDLGISLRSMVKKIFVTHIEKKLDDISDDYRKFCFKAERRIFKIFTEDFLGATSEAKSGRQTFEKLTFFKRYKKQEYQTKEFRDVKILKEWSTYNTTGADFDSCCKFSLARVISGIINLRGTLTSNSGIFLPIVLNVFKNNFGGNEISRLVDPFFQSAVALEGYRVLPAQLTPIVMNTKGASASGKSTIRPRQRLLSEKMSVPWEDFALISPDYWRKFLLDYSSLGSDFKYGAMLTGHELEIIDKKLDLYMEQKALSGKMPHLLIDRFRFDSFIVSGDGNYTSRLLTRFGQKIFLFFVITSPVETVERAWQRGLTTSRYKAVDDLLFHNIEAYAGMPELFFSWMAIADKEINFEFLDNNVSLGDLPKTIAFGDMVRMTILDLAAINNIDLFGEINVNAKSRDEVFITTKKKNYNFVKQCMAKISKVIFVERNTSKIYGVYSKGRWIYRDQFYKSTTSLETECLVALGWYDNLHQAKKCKPVYYTDKDDELTLGSKI